MPIKKVKGGFKWGPTGKVYKDRGSAEKQAKAIRASQAKAKKQKR